MKSRMMMTAEKTSPSSSCIRLCVCKVVDFFEFLLACLELKIFAFFQLEQRPENK